MCLLDIKVKEPTLESILKKKKEYMPPRFMSVNEAASQLIAILDDKIQNGDKELGLWRLDFVILEFLRNLE